MTDLNIFTLRPEGTSLWIPQSIARDLKVDEGARLTEEQYQSPAVQELLQRRRHRQDKQEKGELL